MELSIHEYYTWVEYHGDKFSYYIIIEKDIDNSKVTVRTDDCRSNINLEFLTKALDDFNSENYQYGKFLGE